MAFTATQLATLEKAIAQGATRVQYRDETVEYRSLDDMIKLRNLMRRELGERGLSFGDRAVSAKTDRDLG